METDRQDRSGETKSYRQEYGEGSARPFQGNSQMAGSRKSKKFIWLYKRSNTLLVVVSAVLFLLILMGIIFTVKEELAEKRTVSREVPGTEKYNADRPELEVSLIPENEYSRPGIELKEVKGIVVHYTANPGTTARQNRDYFAGLAETKLTKASSHFIIGLRGEIVQCIPCQEIAYASNSRNKDTISIECCHPDEEGKFNDRTYQSLVELVTWLMGRYHLTTDDVIRHYDVTQKLCPKYYVEHPVAWDQFKEDLNNYIEQKGVLRGSDEDPAMAETEE